MGTEVKEGAEKTFQPEGRISRTVRTVLTSSSMSNRCRDRKCLLSKIRNSSNDSDIDKKMLRWLEFSNELENSEGMD
jgi:hypothetical protein